MVNLRIPKKCRGAAAWHQTENSTNSNYPQFSLFYMSPWIEHFMEQLEQSLTRTENEAKYLLYSAGEGHSMLPHHDSVMPLAAMKAMEM